MKRGLPSPPPAPASTAFLLVITAPLFMCAAVKADPRAQTIEITCTYQRGRYMMNALDVKNFIGTMEKVGSQMESSPFGKAATGSGLHTIYAIAQCYGDLSLVDCVLCYSQARTLLPRCYPLPGGRVYLDGCFVRGENYSFFQEVTGPKDKTICGNRMRMGKEFEKEARKMVGEVVLAAVNNNGYARTEPKATNGSVYVLANCWRTLNASACRACLQNASASIYKCLPWSEGRVLNAGCFVRYSRENFLNAENGNGNSGGNTAVLVVAVVMGSAAVVAIGTVLGLYMQKNKRLQKKRRGPNDMKKLVKILRDSRLNFKFSTVEKATGSFSDSHKLGQGGFGTVYKGVLPDGREIAVKRLFYNNKHRVADFYNEVNIISSVEHKNLVRLLGCSCSGPESLLIYEFLPNESLDRFIFNPDGGKMLNWKMRYEIIIGTVEGLVYLHENTNVRIIHRDIKASNILLDSRFQAKIADFGLARSFQEDKSHISTAIAGTLGYMAPEYLAHGQLTEKADVYSFGVVLLEIIAGERNNRSKSSEILYSLVITVWKHYQDGTVEECFDPNLILHTGQNNKLKDEVLRVVHIGLLCTQENPSLRPTMSKALEMLTKKIENLPAPTNPPFIDEQTMELYHISDTPSPTASFANITYSSFHPR